MRFDEKKKEVRKEPTSTPKSPPAPGSPLPHKTSTAPPWIWVMRGVGVTLFPGLALYTVATLLSRVESLATLLVLFAGTVMGYAVADLISGLVHWASDTYGSSTTPVVGAMMVIPFREHHDDPDGITKETVVELHGVNAFLVLPILLSSIALAGTGQPSLVALFGAVFAAATAFGVVAAGQVHCWTHSSHPPRLISALQERGLVISARDHQAHHNQGFEEDFCILSGWWNRPLKRLGAFRHAERFIATQLQVQPNRAH